MTYRLSDRQLSELVLLVSVSNIVDLFPNYSPAKRTIYRRLERWGISKPEQARKEFRRQLLLAAPPHLTDDDAEVLIEAKIQAMLEDLRTSIESEAQIHKERFSND
nr:hypothetical protein 6 [Paracoccaceae bacterium]